MLSPLQPMISALLVIFLLAIAVEGIIEYLVPPLPARFKPFKPPIAAVLAIVLCLLWRADLLAALGFPAAYPFAGAILTGLIIGRGSNYLAIYIKQARFLERFLPTTVLASVSADASTAVATVTSSTDTSVGDPPDSTPAPPLDVEESTPVQEATPPQEILPPQEIPPVGPTVLTLDQAQAIAARIAASLVGAELPQ